jgi:hypothetical protein
LESHWSVAEDERFEDVSAVFDDFGSCSRAGFESAYSTSAHLSILEVDFLVNFDARIVLNVSKPTSKSKQIEDEFWTHYFFNPRRRWDNWFDKINPRALGFKHKVTHKDLWIHSRGTSKWVKQRFI